MAVSLDGFSVNGRDAPDRCSLDGPAGPDQDGARHRANVELVAQTGLIVIGRGAYDDMVQAWPGSESPMGRLMNELPKVIFSDSLDEVAWDNARLNEEPLEDEIPRLKGEPGRDIIAFGGARFAHSLIAHRLVDEYRLTVHPVALGRGAADARPARAAAACAGRQHRLHRWHRRQRHGARLMRTLHVGLKVRDLEQSLAFYRDLGFEVVGEVPETPLGHLTMLKLPGDEFVTIELVSGGDVTPGDNLSHLVVQIDGPPTDEIRTEWRTDPDGNRIELVQWPDGHPDGMTQADFVPDE